MSPAPHDPCPCGSGRKYKSCCRATDRARQDLLDAAATAHAEIDDLLEVLVPLVESRGEMTIACKAGCCDCCSQLVRTTAAEATRIAEWLAEPEHAAVRERHERAMPAWRERLAGELISLSSLLARHRGAPREGKDLDEYVRAGGEWHVRRVACTFLDEAGRCGIYPVRPLPCRTTYVIDTNRYCAPGQGGTPKVVRHPRLSEAIDAARARLASASDRAGLAPFEGPLEAQVESARRARRKRPGDPVEGGA